MAEQSEERLKIEEDFAYLLMFLPDGWREKARELGALRRRRKIPDAERLLRILLIHLAEGCSLRETALRAQEANLACLSDVAIMDRLRHAGEWLRWMNGEIMKKWVGLQPAAVFGDQWNVRVVDATRVKEPGPTGSSWCIHYSIGLPSLSCQEVLVSDCHGNGESFKRFEVRPGDLLLGDQVYGAKPGIEHVVAHGGQVLVRFTPKILPLLGHRTQRLNLLARLRRLAATEIGDWPAALACRDPRHRGVEGRVCAIRKSREARERGRRGTLRHGQKSGYPVSPEALELADYVMVFTTVDAAPLSAARVLEMYRGRWQIELVFKRLKSILGLGHLRKIDARGARAWLEGKLLVAFLIEALLRAAESFSPWGYPIGAEQGPRPLPLA